jgi:hypothetical protein
MQEVAPYRSYLGNARYSLDLVSLLSQKVVGQSTATKAIVPYVYMYQSGLAPEGRPAGVFLLLGPTGTGKTKTVEAIAELLHAMVLGENAERALWGRGCPRHREGRRLGGESDVLLIEPERRFLRTSIVRAPLAKAPDPASRGSRANGQPRAEEGRRLGGECGVLLQTQARGSANAFRLLRLRCRPMT